MTKVWCSSRITGPPITVSHLLVPNSQVLVESGYLVLKMILAEIVLYVCTNCFLQKRNVPTFCANLLASKRRVAAINKGTETVSY